GQDGALDAHRRQVPRAQISRRPMKQPGDIEKTDHLRSFLESAGPSTRGGAVARVAGRASRKFVTPARVLGTCAMVPFSRRKIANLSHRTPLLLHLGCGYERK